MRQLLWTLGGIVGFLSIQNTFIYTDFIKPYPWISLLIVGAILYYTREWRK